MSTRTMCPTCRTRQSIKKGKLLGKQRLRCLNPACPVHYFTASPDRHKSPYRTAAHYMRAYRARSMLKVYHRSQRATWETPPALFQALDAEFHFTLDACATPQNTKCAVFYTEAEDALAQPWNGTVWCNPPYGRSIALWIHKAWESAQAGATVVCLVKATSDTKWWHQYTPDAEVRFLPGRLTFVGAESPAPFPSCLVIFRSSLA